MFLNTHYHTIDDKGRLTVPAKWRDELESSGVVVTRGVDECIFILPQPKFQAIAELIDAQGLESSDAREWSRYFFGMAEQAEIDKQGRILIPQQLRAFASLDGDVVVIGVYSRIEVWNPEKYQAINSKNESNAPAVAERMSAMMHAAAAVKK